jgi:SAM-dependent methyltransferase
LARNYADDAMSVYRWGMADTHAHHDHHAHRHSGAAEDDYTDLLDLDAEVLRDYWSDALDWVQATAAGTARTRLLDLGAGTGTGAIGLAERFPEAEVIALDVSPVAVAKIGAKAAAAGLAGRVRPVEADLDAGWPELGVLDLTWASASLHHMADPARVLRDVLGATRPGGLIAVSEFASQLLFLPDDLGFGRPGFEGRITDVLGHAYTEEMPTLGSEWAPRLAESGWTVVTEREFRVDQDPPTHPSAARYASAWFARLSEGLADRLAPEDQATLAALLDERHPRSLANRTDLHIRGSRTITIGRRD